MDLDPEKLVFIDETWVKTNMAKLRGRAPKGERLRAAVPHGHWKTTTFIGGLRLTGLTAPTVLDGPVNGVWFQAYVDQTVIRVRAPIAVIRRQGIAPVPPSSAKFPSPLAPEATIAAYHNIRLTWRAPLFRLLLRKKGRAKQRVVSIQRVGEGRNNRAGAALKGGHAGAPPKRFKMLGGGRIELSRR